MSYFNDIPVKKVTLPSNDQYWVELKTDFKYGDIKRFSVLNTEDDQVDFALAGDTFLLVAIQAWNLDDASGKVLPINQETIDKLDRDDAVFLINEANGVISEEDTKKKTS